MTEDEVGGRLIRDGDVCDHTPDAPRSLYLSALFWEDLSAPLRSPGLQISQRAVTSCANSPFVDLGNESVQKER